MEEKNSNIFGARLNFDKQNKCIGKTYLTITNMNIFYLKTTDTNMNIRNNFIKYKYQYNLISQTLQRYSKVYKIMKNLEKPKKCL